MTTALQPLSIDVVSIQSQVIYGRVGNGIAQLALHDGGLQTSVVPTVLLSNTPEYPTCSGGTIPNEWFEGFLRDLLARGAVEQLKAIIVGYLGTPQQAQIVASWIGEVRKIQPSVCVVVDTVIGDHDVGVYVDSGLVKAYRDFLMPCADILTPNGFELNKLAERAIVTLDDTIAVARSLLQPRQSMVVTSAGGIHDSNTPLSVAIVTETSEEMISHPRIPLATKGTGDLLTAELTIGILRGLSLFDAVQRACNRVVEALECTLLANCAELILPAPTSAYLKR